MSPYLPALALVAMLAPPAFAQPEPNDPAGGDDDETADAGDDDAVDDAADEDVTTAPDEQVEVQALRPATAASDEVVPREELDTTPHRDADDLLRLSPGLHLSSHGGRGKAPQIFVRGFDAVHGSDVAVSLEGVPLNEASHVHGQGYLDLQFIPPGAVRSVELAKGAVRADRGDFAIAASVDYRVGLDEPGLRVGVGGGSDRSLRAEAAYRPRRAGPDTFVAGDVEYAEGIGQRRGYRAGRVMGGVGGDVGGAHLRWLAAGYSGVFESPGVLREDDLDAGAIGLYDAYLDTDGGRSHRALTAATLDWAGERDVVHAQLYGGWRQLELVHDFTGWAVHPDHGDARRQRQQAWTWGATASYGHTFALARDLTTLEAGVAVRGDHVDQGEQGLDAATGEPWVTYADADVFQVEPAAWIEADVGLFERVRLVPAVRFDTFVWRIVDRIDEVDGDWVAAADPGPARAHAFALSPKGAAEVVLARGWRAYLSYGRGFRSPPAAELADGQVAPMGAADTVELGTRLARWRGLELRLTGFVTWVANEIVFDHVAARFVASGASRRVGGELVVELRPLRWLRVDADVTYADGRYTVTGAPIPYAPRLLVAAGIHADHRGTVRRGRAAGAPWRLGAGLRGWVLAPRPLTDGQWSRTSWTADLIAGLEVGAVFVELHVDNLFGVRWRDGEFVFPSCFDPAGPCSALPARHVTAGTPFAVRATAGVRLR